MTGFAINNQVSLLNSAENTKKFNRFEKNTGSKHVDIRKGQGIDHENVEGAIVAVQDFKHIRIHALSEKIYSIITAANIAYSRANDRYADTSTPTKNILSETKEDSLLQILQRASNLLPIPLLLLLQAHHKEGIDYPRTFPDIKKYRKYRKETKDILKNMRELAQKPFYDEKVEYEAIRYLYENLTVILERPFNKNLIDEPSLSTERKTYQDLIIKLDQIRREIACQYPTLYWEHYERLGPKIDKQYNSGLVEFAAGIRSARQDLRVYIFDFVRLHLPNGEARANQLQRQFDMNPDYLPNWQEIEQEIADLESRLQEKVSETKNRYSNQTRLTITNNIEQFKIAARALIDIQSQVVNIPIDNREFLSIAEMQTQNEQSRPFLKIKPAMSRLAQILYRTQVELNNLSLSVSANEKIKPSDIQAREASALAEMHGVITRLNQTTEGIKIKAPGENGLNELVKRIQKKANPEFFKAANSSQKFFSLAANKYRAASLNTKLALGCENKQDIINIYKLFKINKEDNDKINARRFFIARFFDFQGRALSNGIEKTLNNIHKFAQKDPEFANLLNDALKSGDNISLPELEHRNLQMNL